MTTAGAMVLAWFCGGGLLIVVAVSVLALARTRRRNDPDRGE